MGEKVEQPTPHRLQRAHRDGDVAKSAALTVTLSGVLWWLFLLIEAPRAYTEFVEMTAYVMRLDPTLPLNTRFDLVLDAAIAPLETALATLGVAVLAVCVPELAQARGVFAMKRITPDLNRINPVQGFKNLFSVKILFETALMTGQFAILVFVCWMEIAQWLAQLAPALALTLPSQLTLAGRAHAHLLALACLSQIAPGAIDLAIQQFIRRRRLRMDKEEVKREFREQQGDPRMKQRRRSEHRKLND